MHRPGYPLLLLFSLSLTKGREGEFLPLVSIRTPVLDGKSPQPLLVRGLSDVTHTPNPIYKLSIQWFVVGLNVSVHSSIKFIKQ